MCVRACVRGCACMYMCVCVCYYLQCISHCSHVYMHTYVPHLTQTISVPPIYSHSLQLLLFFSHNYTGYHFICRWVKKLIMANPDANRSHSIIKNLLYQCLWSPYSQFVSLSLGCCYFKRKKKSWKRSHAKV